eukprot:3941615-Rhodomonas_salina.4
MSGTDIGWCSPVLRNHDTVPSTDKRIRVPPYAIPVLTQGRLPATILRPHSSISSTDIGHSAVQSQLRTLEVSRAAVEERAKAVEEQLSGLRTHVRCRFHAHQPKSHRIAAAQWCKVAPYRSGVMVQNKAESKRRNGTKQGRIEAVQ